MTIKGEYANSSLALKQGIVIDLQKRNYSKFTSVFRFFKFRDTPKALPSVDYVLLFKTLYTKCAACSIADFENDSVFQLSLVHDKSHKLIVHETRDREQIFGLAAKLAGELKVGVKDVATDRRNPVWLSI